jgi:hypothetical protein
MKAMAEDKKMTILQLGSYTESYFNVSLEFYNLASLPLK